MMTEKAMSQEKRDGYILGLLFGAAGMLVFVAILFSVFPEQTRPFEIGYDLGLLESCRDKVRVVAYQDGDSSVVQVTVKD